MQKGYEESLLVVTQKSKSSALPNSVKATIFDHTTVYNNLTTENGFINSEQYAFIDDPAFIKDLLTIEQKHPQVTIPSFFLHSKFQGRTKMKIGVVYCKSGQVTAPEMFTNGRSFSVLFSF